MTAPENLRITGPEDILGFIPHSLGYWPENSLVAMTMQGKRLGATLRVDLPEPGGGASGGPSAGAGGGSSAGIRGSAAPQRRSSSGTRDPLAGYARNVVSYLQADDAADGSLLAFFTDADFTGAGDGTAWAELLRELELALEAAGLPVRDAWIVGAEFWRNAHCTDPECCAPPGRPVEQIRNSRLNAEMVFRGSSVGAAPGAESTARAPRQVDRAVLAAELGWTEQFSLRWRNRAQFAQVLDVWTMVMQAATLREPAGGPPELSPELAGYLRASLCISSWRDAVLVMAAAGRPAAERGAEDFGMFDTEARSNALPGAVAVSQLRPMPRPIPGPRIPSPKPGSAPGPTPGSPAGPAVGSNPGSSPGPRSDPRPPSPKALALPSASGGAPAAAGAVPCSGAVPSPDAVPGAGAVPGYGEVLLGLAPSVPDWTMMVGLERVLKLLGGLGDGEPTAAAATARGWIEWCRGRGSYADALYRQALQERPGYRLAELLAELGRRGTLCGWAARREAAWQKFSPDAA